MKDLEDIAREMDRRFPAQRAEGMCALCSRDADSIVSMGGEELLFCWPCRAMTCAYLVGYRDGAQSLGDKALDVIRAAVRKRK